MNTSELFYRLSYGQLSNLAMCENSPGTIREADRPKVVIAANEALLRIYTRFPIKQNALVVRMWEHITNYHFLKKFCESEYPQSGEKYPYILDLPKEPFKEDVIRVLEVYNECGRLPLNDDEHEYSVFTPQPNMIQVPHPMRRGSFSLTYQAKHVPITLEDLTQEIKVPDALEGALLSYIAYTVYSNMNTVESVGKAQEHMMMYENICASVEMTDVSQTSVSTSNSRFYKRGWI